MCERKRSICVTTSVDTVTVHTQHYVRVFSVCLTKGEETFVVGDFACTLC